MTSLIMWLQMYKLFRICLCIIYFIFCSDITYGLQVESIMESMKTAYLADQRGRRDGNDPFLEADWRETAKQVAAARRVHPTLHLPSSSQPSTQAAGSLLAATPATSAAPPASALAATGGSGLFSTPFSSTSSSSISSTPATSALSFPLFQSSGASPQTSIFGPSSGSAPSLFNSTPGATGSSLFSTPFTTNPSTGASAFSTPFGTGISTVLGPHLHNKMLAIVVIGLQQDQEQALILHLWLKGEKGW
ncbi:putative nucleoporin p58/p45 [Helianthus annuus]|nr:putative nucleoporin p58/p45 [Helianthus annuus]